MDWCGSMDRWMNEISQTVTVRWPRHNSVVRMATLHILATD